MQSLLPLRKLFFCGLVATAFVSILSPPAVAQVYQVRPDGSLIYQPGYVNPNFRQVNPNFRQYTAEPQIYPGQIINGERVIGTSNPTPPISRREAVNPPQPPASSPDPRNQNPTQQNQRPITTSELNTASEPNAPIPTGPALQSEPSSKSVTQSPPEAPEAVNTETPLNSESSVDTEEKNEPADPTESREPQIPAENQSIEVEMTDLEILQNDQPPLEISSNSDQGDLPSSEIPAEDPASPSDLSETPSSTDLSIDEITSREAPSEELPNLAPPISETPQDDSAVAPPTLDEEIDEDIMNEIKQIRAQLGGGIAETLQDVEQMPSFGSIEITPPQDPGSATTDKEVSPEDLFNEELRSVMSEQQSAGNTIITAPQTIQSPRSTNSSTQLPEELTYEMPYADRTQELRNCARELEQLAGRLEAIAAYEYADQVRSQAAQLWTTARQR